MGARRPRRPDPHRPRRRDLVDRRGRRPGSAQRRGRRARHRPRADVPPRRYPQSWSIGAPRPTRTLERHLSVKNARRCPVLSPMPFLLCGELAGQTASAATPTARPVACPETGRASRQHAKNRRSEVLLSRLKNRHTLHVRGHRKDVNQKHVEGNRRSAVHDAHSGPIVGVHYVQSGHYGRPRDAPASCR